MTQDLNSYFKELGCDYWYEYDKVYCDLDVKDKVVIQVGGDCGSSAIYFVMKGAKRVIFYESDPNLVEKFRKDVCSWFDCSRIEARGKWDGKDYPDGDIFTIDCEGCEVSLDFSAIRKYQICLVSVHNWIPYEGWTKLIPNLVNWKLVYSSRDSKELTFRSPW